MQLSMSQSHMRALCCGKPCVHSGPSRNKESETCNTDLPTIHFRITVVFGISPSRSFEVVWVNIRHLPPLRSAERGVAYQQPRKIHFKSTVKHAQCSEFPEVFFFLGGLLIRARILYRGPPRHTANQVCLQGVVSAAMRVFWALCFELEVCAS